MDLQNNSSDYIVPYKEKNLVDNQYCSNTFTTSHIGIHPLQFPSTYTDWIGHGNESENHPDSTTLDVHHRNNKGRTILHLAARDGDVDNMEFFLALGADVNAVDSKGHTPLHAAVSSNLYAVKWLIERGADVTLVDCNGDSAAVLARRKGKEGMFRYLQKEISLALRMFH